MDEIRDAEVRIENRGRSRLRVRAWLRVSPEARIDDVLDGVDEAADWLVHHRLGLLLAEPPLADVKYDELDLRPTRPASPRRTRPERKRVVSGTSVSVRVDLGGRRIIKKKKTYNNKHT